MRTSKKIAIIILISIFILIPGTAAVRAQEKASQQQYCDLENIDITLSPYRNIINEVNSQIGSTMFIPEYNKERVYNYYKNYSLEEFKESITRDYNLTQEHAQATNTFIPENIVIDKIFPVNEKPDSFKGEIAPLSVVENATQVRPISYNSYLYLDSTIFGGGNPFTYRYQTINRIYSGYPSGYKGFHFDVRGKNYYLNNDRTRCTVNIWGAPVNEAGIELLVQLREVVTYIAGN